MYEPIPNETNVEYAFQRLILPIIEATGFKPYISSHQEYKDVLEIVINWIITYANTKDLKCIDLNEFIKIKEQLFDLDKKYLLEDGLYAEEAYEWILQLEIILEKSMKERN